MCHVLFCFQGKRGQKNSSRVTPRGDSPQRQCCHWPLLVVPALTQPRRDYLHSTFNPCRSYFGPIRSTQSLKLSLEPFGLHVCLWWNRAVLPRSPDGLLSNFIDNSLFILFYFFTIIELRPKVSFVQKHIHKFQQFIMIYRKCQLI
jgi:hypothetical protein